MVSTRFLTVATIATLAGCSTLAPTSTGTSQGPDRVVQVTPTSIQFSEQDLQKMRASLPQQLSADQIKKLVKIDPDKVRQADRTVQHRFGRFGFGRFGWGGFGWGGLGWGGLGFWPYSYAGLNLYWPYTWGGSIYGTYPYGYYGGLLTPWWGNWII
ncbi:MAG: hypothetical protein FJZ01_16025 [Candidatus Sericytochromatia bacterium]|nr:hypothetical protein [Candidatus Tanganyikabacteria bacterium]